MLNRSAWIPPLTDDERVRLRSRLMVILYTLLAVSVVLLQLKNPVNRAAALAATILMAVSLFLTYKGRLAFPRFAVPIGFLALITTFAANGAGLRDAAVFGFYIVISMSGLLLGERTIFITMGVTIACTFGIYFADNAGFIHTAQQGNYTFSDATYISAYIIIATMILRMIITNLNKSIQATRRNEDALVHLNNDLEARIQRRTRQVEESRREAELMYKIAEHLNSTTTYNDILQVIIEEIGPQKFTISLNIFEHYDLKLASYTKTPALVPAGQAEVLPVDSITPIGTRPNEQGGEMIEDMDAPTVRAELRDFYTSFGIRAMIDAPIKIGERLVGSISFTWDTPHQFTSFEKNLVHGLADLIASSTERTRLFEEIIEAQTQTDLLYRISQEMNGAQDYVQIVNAIASHLTYPKYQLALALYEGFDREKATYFDLVAGRVGENSDVESMTTRLDANLNRAWTLEDVFVLENINTDSRLSEEARQYYLKNQNQAGLVAGVLLSGRVTGALHLTFAEPRSFTPQEIQTWRAISDLAASAIERVRLYTEQVRIADELRALDQMKSQFLASMSHELRTPLNAILNFSEFINLGLLGPVTEKQQDALGKVLGSGKHLLALINDVLDMTKIQAGMMTLFVEAEVNVNQEAETVCSAIESMFNDRPVKFIRDIDADLPIMVGDRRRVRQILLNLLSNAAKFTEEGSVTLSVKHRHDEILIVVSDTGPGIALEDQPIIFEPFRQTETGIQHAGGTGLGLPISRKLAEAHGGNLWVESELGEGANFYVTLPTCAPQLVQMLKEANETMELVNA